MLNPLYEIYKVTSKLSNVYKTIYRMAADFVNVIRSNACPHRWRRERYRILGEYISGRPQQVPVAGFRRRII